MEKNKTDTNKMEWNEITNAWICKLCRKKVHSKQARSKHNKKDCLNTQPNNPSWQLGWDRSTMSCRYCLQKFARRRGIRLHLQRRICPKLPNWNKVFGRVPADFAGQGKGEQAGEQGQGKQAAQQGNKRGKKGKKGKQRKAPEPDPVPEEDEDDDEDEDEDWELAPGEELHWTGNSHSMEQSWTEPHSTLENRPQAWPAQTFPQAGPSRDSRPQLCPPTQLHQEEARWSDRTPAQYLRPSSQDQYSSELFAHVFQRLAARCTELPSPHLPGMARKGGQASGPEGYPGRPVQTSAEGRPSDQSSYLPMVRPGSYPQQPDQGHMESWPEGDTLHSFHSGSSETWTRSLREGDQAWSKREPVQHSVDNVRNQYDQRYSHEQGDGRHSPISQRHWNGREQNYCLIDPDSGERRGRPDRPEQFGRIFGPTSHKERRELEQNSGLLDCNRQERLGRCDRAEQFRERPLPQRMPISPGQDYSSRAPSPGRHRQDDKSLIPERHPQDNYSLGPVRHCQDGFKARRPGSYLKGDQIYNPTGRDYPARRLSPERHHQEAYGARRASPDMHPLEDYSARRPSLERHHQEDYSARRSSLERHHQEDYSTRRSSLERHHQENYSARRSSLERHQEDHKRSSLEIHHQEGYSARRSSLERHHQEDYSARRSSLERHHQEGYSARRSSLERHRQEDYSARPSLEWHHQEDYSARPSLEWHHQEDYSARSSLEKHPHEDFSAGSRNRCHQDYSARRHDSYQEEGGWRGYAHRSRSRSPAGHRNIGGQSDRRSCNSETRHWNSYRTNADNERYPKPEQHSRGTECRDVDRPGRDTAYHDDKYNNRTQRPREYSRSQDVSYHGHQRDRGSGRYLHQY
ncbi:uncharacterized protein LOC143282212 isoform X2 [Babylonia areolata]